jgi:hypothetical protein
MNIDKLLLEKKFLVANDIVTSVPNNKLQSKGIAIQLDSTLMNSRFKLSKDLFKYISSLENSRAFEVANIIIQNVKSILGDDVKHNVYFKEFPKNVPDTLDFWIKCIIELFIFGDTEYGSYQHTYEEMLEFHDEFKPKNNRKIRYIELGQSTDKEATQLANELIGSSVPLNSYDREVISFLVKNKYWDRHVQIPLRENMAIVGSVLLENNEPPVFDTVTDCLRLVSHLSDGDVTLVDNTKFKNLSRKVRRLILRGLEYVPAYKYGDVFLNTERFKRLAKTLHPRDYPEYKNANYLFELVHNRNGYQRWEGEVSSLLQRKLYREAMFKMKDRPGVFVRNIGQVLRNGTLQDATYLFKFIDQGVLEKIPTRTLISLIQGVCYPNAIGKRVFTNMKGKSYVVDDTNPIREDHQNKLYKKVLSVLKDRNNSNYAIMIDPKLKDIVVPTSEKNKVEGFNTLSRGSIINIDPKEFDTIRLFFYWHQQRQRTDYDLSAVSYSKDGDYLGHVGWTSYHGGSWATYSGDLTEARNGASEFIDINVKALLKTGTGFILPSLNRFAGETYDDLKDNFMGYMLLNKSEKGKPFEPMAVETKFKIVGNSGVYTPFVFIVNEDNTFSMKWLDTSMRGSSSGNMIEAHSNDSSVLMTSLVNKRYLTIGEYLPTFGKVTLGNKVSKKHTHYVALERPESLPENVKFVGLNDLKNFV